MELMRSYFPALSDDQVNQFEMLDPLYRSWNEKINVISRKDIDHLFEHHILHSLALAKKNIFQADMKVLDVGTGGGFPGIPLAIMFPQVHFTLLDSIGKKIRVVDEVAKELQLRNVTPVNRRAEEFTGDFDLVISRAVSAIDQLIQWTQHLVPAQTWVMLKGGDPKEIRKEITPDFATTFKSIHDYFNEIYFLEKYIVTVKRK